MSGASGQGLHRFWMVNDFGNNGMPAGLTRFVNFGQTSTDTLARNAMCFAGTIRNLYVRTNGTSAAAGTTVVTMVKNGSDQAVTISIAAGSPTGWFSDLTHSFDVALGDEVSVRIVNNDGANASAPFICVAWEVDVQ